MNATALSLPYQPVWNWMQDSVPHGGDLKEYLDHMMYRDPSQPIGDADLQMYLHHNVVGNPAAEMMYQQGKDNPPLEHLMANAIAVAETANKMVREAAEAEKLSEERTPSTMPPAVPMPMGSVLGTEILPFGGGPSASPIQVSSNTSASLSAYGQPMYSSAQPSSVSVWTGAGSHIRAHARATAARHASAAKKPPPPPPSAGAGHHMKKRPTPRIGAEMVLVNVTPNARLLNYPGYQREHMPDTRAVMPLETWLKLQQCTQITFPEKRNPWPQMTVKPYFWSAGATEPTFSLKIQEASREAKAIREFLQKQKPNEAYPPLWVKSTIEAQAQAGAGRQMKMAGRGAKKVVAATAHKKRVGAGESMQFSSGDDAGQLRAIDEMRATLDRMKLGSDINSAPRTASRAPQQQFESEYSAPRSSRALSQQQFERDY
jgi:hypothetical protein